MWSERVFRRALIIVALAGLILGVAAWGAGRADLAAWCWAGGTIPVIAGLVASIARDLWAGRMGVDSIALVSMSGAVALGENLAGIVVAIMYAGGNLLEDIAVAHAERDLRSLIDRAPRVAHRLDGSTISDIPIEQLAVGEVILVRSGEVIPVDGIITSAAATIDESALTGEPIPVSRQAGEPARSGSLNAGTPFEIRSTATAGDSTYAGIVRMVSAAQTARSPFIRLADRYALLLLPVTLAIAGAAWLVSGDSVRALAVLVAATPCPLILAAPVAFISGVARAAKRGILVKGSGPLEALAQTHTVMFDKTGTLTVGGARLVAIEVAPNHRADEVLQLAASLEQSSHHVVAIAIVEAAIARGLTPAMASEVRETAGAGLQGVIEGRTIRVGSHQLVNGAGKPEAWIVRALRRAAWRSALSVFVAVDGRTIGALLLADELRRETPRAIQGLRKLGVARIVMVTGDRAEAAETIGAALDLDAVLSDRAPEDKVEAVAAEQRRNVTVMVGDGINDAPALAAANVGVALGARGASASSEAADVVILVDRLDAVPDAISIARRTRAIALQSIVAGLALSGLAMAVAAIGWLPPVAGALTQEAIDVAVILNALRALSAGRARGRRTMPVNVAGLLHADHAQMEPLLNRLREIADGLDRASGAGAIALISEAERIVANDIAPHERNDESLVYPRVAKYLADRHGLGAMSRAHREISHQSRLLRRLADGLRADDVDSYLVRDAQRVIESVEALVRIHNAQEEDIYEYAIGA
ncbi:MAG TPA: heavy metal translocating P-type ATPase [Bradyrhizobium sp.]|uniref:heavy metal translocating P-type ATPase n=1 Tax=Bradyrhizobium sp. TaxID=376 RepID=UPI002D7EFF16|nr:heavy metal translocating P-type ATPase [Bradyrhizobium sp.]HET7888008.1 heavy metal translocating P-type ATPase [Bradyrhizobium sp.]